VAQPWLPNMNGSHHPCNPFLSFPSIPLFFALFPLEKVSD
jgi:hypothetical protein